eukprot:3803417-Pyramimonas_sp.AAC.1
MPRCSGYYAQETGITRIGTRPDNPCGRATAGGFYQSQQTRGAGCDPGVPGQVPHCGYLAAPMGPELTRRGPELVVPSSMGELRPEILAAHGAQQVNLSTQLTCQRRNQERQLRRMMSRAGAPAAPAPAGQPA